MPGLIGNPVEARKPEDITNAMVEGLMSDAGFKFAEEVPEAPPAPPKPSRVGLVAALAVAAAALLGSAKS